MDSTIHHLQPSQILISFSCSSFSSPGQAGRNNGMYSCCLQLRSRPNQLLKSSHLFHGPSILAWSRSNSTYASLPTKIQRSLDANLFTCPSSRRWISSTSVHWFDKSHPLCVFPSRQIRTLATQPTSKPPSLPDRAQSSPSTDSSTTNEANQSDKTSSNISISELKQLVSLARPEAKLLAIAGGLIFVSSGVSLSVPFLWGKVIDVFTSPEVSQSLSLSLPTAAGLLAGFFLIGAGANTLRVIIMRIAGQQITQRLRTSAFNSVIQSDITWHDLRASGLSKGQGGTGDLVSRLGSDASIVGESITRDLADGTRALITTIAGVSMMFYISSKLTLVMLTVVPPTAIGAIFFGRYLKKLSKLTQESLGRMINFSAERLNEVRTVHSFNAVPLEQKSFSNKVDEIFDLARKEAFASGLFFGGRRDQPLLSLDHMMWCFRSWILVIWPGFYFSGAVRLVVDSPATWRSLHFWHMVAH